MRVWAKLPKINKESPKNCEKRVKQSIHPARCEHLEMKADFPQMPTTVVLQCIAEQKSGQRIDECGHG
jgi:hypothetical protein